MADTLRQKWKIGELSYKLTSKLDKPKCSELIFSCKNLKNLKFYFVKQLSVVMY